MPFVLDEKMQSDFARVIGQPELESTDDVEFTEMAAAAFRLENSLGSLITRNSGLPDDVVNNESFNPWNHMSDEEKLDPVFTKNISRVDTVEEINAVRQQRDRERKDRDMLANGGAESFFAQLAAGVFDPINLIPVGGTTYKTYRTGASILKAAAATGGVAAGSQAAVEAALHMTQIERTYGESAINVSGAALLGGVLGGAVSAIKGGVNVDANFSKQIEDSLDPEGKIKTEQNSIFSNEQHKSAGAAGVDTDVRVQGKIARALTKALGFDPLSRSLTSDLPETRFMATQLAENPIAMENKSGNFVADSVETNTKIKDGLYFKALTSHIDEFEAYSKNGGALKRKQFNEAVSKEIRNPESTDPNIKAAAEKWRSELYEPIKKELIEQDLLPKDVDVTTATNYLNRIYNKDKLATNLGKFVDTTSAWLKEQDAAAGRLDIDDAEYLDLARDIAARIRSTPDGRLPYDYKLGEGSSSSGFAGKPGIKGPLKKRTFDIPDKLIEDFLENDVELLGGRYLRALAIDIELAKKFGKEVVEQPQWMVKDIEQAWSKRIEEASRTDKKLARKLEKQRDKDIESIAAMRDRLRGTYGQTDYDNFWVRSARASRDLNYLRLMGGVVAASIPDVARIIGSNGIAKTFKFGLKPLMTNMKGFKVSAAEAKKYGVGTDVLMGGRSEIIADVADYSQGGTAFERGLRSAAENFGKINLMDRWTAGVKQLHAVVAQTDMAEILTKGGYDKRFQQLGIDEGTSTAIAEQLRKHGRKVDGVWIANTKNWDSADLINIWGGALRKESDRVIVVPGQERPLFMSTELGKTIFQFKTFMFSATQRVLISSLQNQDQAPLQGLLGLVSLGMMSYYFKQWDAGREVTDDPTALIVEGLDRSGALGILMEMNNTLEKVSSNNYGLRPLLGVSAPASRYASRNMVEAALGPTFGSLFSTAAKVSGGVSDGTIEESDIRAMRRLIPYQNLMILRQGFDKLEEEFE